MKRISEDAYVYGRKRLFNECIEGHKQPVHHRFCTICGKQIIAKYSAASWNEIKLKQMVQFRLIHQDNTEPYDRAFISIFNNNLLFIQDNRNAILIKNIISAKGVSKQTQSFELGVQKDLVRSIITQNNSIFILCGTKLYILDWVSVLNFEFTNLTEIVCKGDILDIAYHKHLYFYTPTGLFRIDDSKSAIEIFKAPANERICHVSTSLDAVLIVSRNEFGSICLRTYNVGSMDSFTQDAIIRDSENSEVIFSAVGKDYYAVCMDSKKMVMGKLAGLQTSKQPHWRVEPPNMASGIFFVKNLMYVICDDSLLQWDLDNFTYQPASKKDNLALSLFPYYLNIDNSRICIIASQGKNSYIAILDVYLNEQSRSSSFSQTLVSFTISDNLIYAITKEENTSFVYGE
ncbi:MAG: hypothetical protein PHC50_01280 [Candidatus Cloacimonetes bacterium]|nr:hypothetical protein [Candidatus Cloacimonadota bacterium]